RWRLRITVPRARGPGQALQLRAWSTMGRHGTGRSHGPRAVAAPTPRRVPRARMRGRGAPSLSTPAGRAGRSRSVRPPARGVAAPPAYRPRRPGRDRRAQPGEDRTLAVAP